MARADGNGIALDRLGSASDEAAAWFVRLRDTALSDQERSAFADWLAICPSHAAAMADMADIWDGLDALPDLRASRQMQMLPPPPPKYLTRRNLLAGLGLSGVALSAVAATSWGGQHQRAYTAPFGAPRHVGFTDDAALDLDSLSSVEVDPREPQPRATLDRGQVFVTSRRPAGRPITLLVPFGRLRAEEAVFNLKLERHRALVSVQSGRVFVDPQQGAAREIGPLMEFAFGAGAGDEPRLVAPYRIAPWRDGRLIFDRTLLVDAIDDLNRYRRGRIVIGDPRLDDLLVTGTFGTDRADEALEAIKTAFSLKSLHFGDSLTMLFAA